MKAPKVMLGSHDEPVRIRPAGYIPMIMPGGDPRAIRGEGEAPGRDELRVLFPDEAVLRVPDRVTRTGTERVSHPPGLQHVTVSAIVLTASPACIRGVSLTTDGAQDGFRYG